MQERPSSTFASSPSSILYLLFYHMQKKKILEVLLIKESQSNQIATVVQVVFI